MARFFVYKFETLISWWRQLMLEKLLVFSYSVRLEMAYCIYWNNWNAEITEMASIQGVLYLLKQAFTEMSYCIYWNNWNELLYLLK